MFGIRDPQLAGEEILALDVAPWTCWYMVERCCIGLAACQEMG